MLHQLFPAAGLLSGNLDWGKARLGRAIADGMGGVYAYVMSTVILEGGEFQQTGCGPNFQGGLLTLCTCKHRMRTSLACEAWKDKWVAGFTSLKCGGRHCLFYLARVAEAFESQSELWLRLSEEVRQAKSASDSELGDLYEPEGILSSDARFDPSRYRTPVPEHVHHRLGRVGMWKIDIDYRRKKLKTKAKRAPALLVGDPQSSFLWRKPKLYVDGRWRQTNYGNTAEFLQDLKVDGDGRHVETSGATACRC
jgi:hypothetical protein